MTNYIHTGDRLRQLL